MRVSRAFLYAFALTLGMGAACAALAWTTPTGTAPANNVAAPLNVSNTAQTKVGALQINTGGATTGLTVGGGTILAGGSSSNWAPLNVGAWGAVSINAAGSIYSYNSICTGNNSGDCSSTGGVVLKANGTITAVGKITAGPVNGVSNALLSARANGDAVEWGHTNTAGYGGTLGTFYNSGNPYIAFDAQAGTNPNTFKTNGIRGAAIVSDLAGGFVFDTVPVANADNQAAIFLASLSNAGTITAASFVYSSDERLKKNIAAITNSTALQDILGLQPVTFDWIDTTKPTTTQLGFIAQQVEKIVPELVTTDPATTLKAVDYARVTPLLVGAAQAQQAQIDAQQKEIEELKAEVEALKAGK